MARLHRLIARALGGAKPLPHYASGAPTLQHIADVFAGEWVSRFPANAPAQTSGEALLFEDARLAWGLDRLGGVRGKRVIELGPLEGGHSYMLQSAGAAMVHAVEANQRAFLRCLAVKEIFGLDRVRFMLGDFVEYLRSSREQYDVCIASGVLYHMSNPVELIELIARHASACYGWTHYFEPELAGPGSRVHERGPAPVALHHAQFSCTAYRMRYGISRNRAGFCGSAAVAVTWLTRADIERCFRHFGFSAFEVAYEEPEHPSGPSLAFVAQRANSTALGG